MTITLPSELTLANADSFLAAMRKALQTPDAQIELETNTLESVDVAGLQILCAAHRFARSRGKQMTFSRSGRGAVLEDALRRAGFARPHGCGADCFWLEERHG